MKSKIIMIAAISLLCSSCGGITDEPHIDSQITSILTSEPEFEITPANNQETKTSAESIENELRYLKQGDTKSLVGFSFGDEFDYELFEISGFGHGEMRYRRKNSESTLNYCFDQEGNRFSGLSAFASDKSFFGIKFDKDTLDTLIAVLGEPQVRKPDSDGGFFAIFYFDEAYLSVKISEYGTIRYAEYMSLTEFEKDFMSKYCYAEAVYNWEAVYNSRSKPTEASYHPYDDDYEESKVPAFIKNYLQTQGVVQEIPDGVAYNQQGEPLVEYYIDQDKEQYCFVVHLWGEYWVDYEAGISKYRDAIYCTTYYLDEADKLGNLIYENDSEQNSTYERAYDVQGKLMAEVSYEYFSGIPFPLITESWNLDAGYAMVKSSICRGQKFWFTKEQVEFDTKGQFAGYKGNDDSEDYKNYLSSPCESTYDAEGRLKTIKEKPQDDIECQGYMEFDYYENGNVKAVDYFRSPRSYGTTDSNGIIVYDEMGRMIYNNYYITHGGHVDLYLYHDDSERPWVIFNWCSFAPGFISINMFQPIEK